MARILAKSAREATTDEEDIVARVKEITADKGARIIFDPIGGKGLETLASAAAYGAIIIEYGALATDPTPFPLFSALAKALTIRGYTLFEIASDPATLATARKYVFDHLAAIELIKAEGAISIATTRTSAKKDELLAFGADHVIVTDEEDLVARVNQITSSKGARIIFDPIGGKILDSLAVAASKNGIIFEYGALAPEPTPYPLFTALSKFLTIRAYTLFEVAANPAEYAKASKYIYDHLAAGNFKVIIDKTFPFSEIAAAHRYLESNAQIGKIVVTL